MTTKERFLRLADELSEPELDDLLRYAERQHEDDAQSSALGRASAKGYERIPPTPEEDGWALVNAREALREESW